MNRCADQGMLVSGAVAIPTDPTDLHVGDLAAVGCNNLRCNRCEVAVRSVVGRELVSRTGASPAELAALYATADLTTSPALRQADPTRRLYLCRCTRWVEDGEHACRAPDFDPYTDPDVPWSCAGHPVLTLPHDLDGTYVADPAALFDVVVEGLRGRHPSGTRLADQARGDWVTRLVSRLGADDAAVVVRAARAVLHAPVPRARAGALWFFRARPDAVAQGAALALLTARSPLLIGVPDDLTPYPQFDPTLEDSAWRVVEPLVASPGPARTLAREEALAGRGRRALFTALAAHDAAWLVDSVEAIVRVQTSLAPGLLASLSRLPPAFPRRAVVDRITAAAAAGPAAPAATLPPEGSLSFDAALVFPGAVLAAWDHQGDDDNELRIYAVGPTGAHHLASALDPAGPREAAREAKQSAMRTRGVRVGGAWPWSGHVWVMDEEGCAIWSRTTRLAEGTRAELRLRDRVVVPSEVARVVSFLDPADSGHRGVRFELHSGAQVVVAEEFAPPDPVFFDELDTLDDDVRWATYVGYGLATWLGVPHVRLDGSVRGDGAGR